jgi:hypothetical protein
MSFQFALLGGPSSGKTTGWAAAFHEFREAVSAPPLTSSLKAQYRRWNVKKQIGFRMRIPDGELKMELQKNSQLLDERPIRQWPGSTTRLLDNSQVDIQFDFVDIESDSEQGHRPVKSYTRQFKIFDPPGGVFTGRHELSAQTLKQLATCDGAIAFLPMDIILNALGPEPVEEDAIKLAVKQLVLAPVHGVLREMRQRGHYGDIFPVCCVISKSDICDQAQFGRVEDFLYNPDYGVISRLSADNPDMMLCVVPVSIVNPETGSFKAMNLQWPFLFAAAATIFRNHVELMAKADSDQQRAQDYDGQAAAYEGKACDFDAAAARLRQSGWFSRFASWWATGERVGTIRDLAARERREAAEKWEAAQSYRNSAGRKVQLAADDKELARDTWSALAVEGRHRNVKVFLGGRGVEDISLLMR